MTAISLWRHLRTSKYNRNISKFLFGPLQISTPSRHHVTQGYLKNLLESHISSIDKQNKTVGVNMLLHYSYLRNLGCGLFFYFFLMFSPDPLS
jgi:hypothetical protein